jgi:hypothetical protein
MYKLINQCIDKWMTVWEFSIKRRKRPVNRKKRLGLGGERAHLRALNEVSGSPAGGQAMDAWPLLLFL